MALAVSAPRAGPNVRDRHSDPGTSRNAARNLATRRRAGSADRRGRHSPESDSRARPAIRSSRRDRDPRTRVESHSHRRDRSRKRVTEEGKPGRGHPRPPERRAGVPRPPAPLGDPFPHPLRSIGASDKRDQALARCQEHPAPSHERSRVLGSRTHFRAMHGATVSTKAAAGLGWRFAPAGPRAPAGATRLSSRAPRSAKTFSFRSTVSPQISTMGAWRAVDGSCRATSGVRIAARQARRSGASSSPSSFEARRRAWWFRHGLVSAVPASRTRALPNSLCFSPPARSGTSRRSCPCCLGASGSVFGKGLGSGRRARRATGGSGGRAMSDLVFFVVSVCVVWLSRGEECRLGRAGPRWWMR